MSTKIGRGEKVNFQNIKTIYLKETVCKVIPGGRKYCFNFLQRRYVTWDNWNYNIVFWK